METWGPILLVATMLIVFLGEFLVEILGFIPDVLDDLNNRNDRGLLKKPSSKNVV